MDPSQAHRAAVGAPPPAAFAASRAALSKPIWPIRLEDERMAEIWTNHQTVLPGGDRREVATLIAHRADCGR